MDEDRFDLLTRSLARTSSRRTAAKGITALLAGAALSGGPSPAEGAPNPCNVYCAGESGPRGAQCRQACKACGGPTAPGFCYDEAARSYTCCPGGLSCFDAWSYPEGRTVICCAGVEQVCNQEGSAYCCPDGTYCANDNLCCPGGVDACYDQAADALICGNACYDICTNHVNACGEADANGYCAANTCFDSCSGGFACGAPDENGECVVDRCFDLCSQATVCSEPNANGNCLVNTCYDPCLPIPGDTCGYPDESGNCSGIGCFDPNSGMVVCGERCDDICTSTTRCGTTGVGGYCTRTACFQPGVGYVCGITDDGGFLCAE